MRKLAFSCLVMILVSASCTSHGRNENVSPDSNPAIDSQKIDTYITNDHEGEDSISYSAGLNSIRFEDWGSKEWLDNDYIRELRSYLNACADGKIINEDLDQYKEIIKSKFIIANIEPYLLGGAFIQIIFPDMPSKLFVSWVYSDVDEEKKEVTGYEVRYVKVDEDDFQVSVIPHTGEETTLLRRKPGDAVNLENDVVGKYIERLLGFASKEEASKQGSQITMEFLEKYGF